MINNIEYTSIRYIPDGEINKDIEYMAKFGYRIISKKPISHRRQLLTYEITQERIATLVILDIIKPTPIPTKQKNCTLI